MMVRVPISVFLLIYAMIQLDNLTQRKQLQFDTMMQLQIWMISIQMYEGEIYRLTTALSYATA